VILNGDPPASVAVIVTLTLAARLPVFFIFIDLIVTFFTTPNAIDRVPTARCANDGRTLTSPSSAARVSAAIATMNALTASKTSALRSDFI
jgi:hypothetical protein